MQQSVDWRFSALLHEFYKTSMLFLSNIININILSNIKKILKKNNNNWSN